MRPANAAAAGAALARVKELAPRQECSRYFRAWLQAEGWETPSGDSPVVPLRLEHLEAAWSLATALRQTASSRPPCGSRLYPWAPAGCDFSLKRTFGDEEVIRVLLPWLNGVLGNDLRRDRSGARRSFATKSTIFLF